MGNGDFNIESEDLRLLDAAVCGAFVHGLEDEFEAVRQAAVDMFNDEMANVRLNSIHTLHKIANRWTVKLNDTQLETLLMVFQDASAVVRVAAYQMLGLMKLENSNALDTLLTPLSQNLVRFPADEESIYSSLRDIGDRNAQLVEPKLIQRLLRIDPKYLPKENALDDKCLQYLPSYVLRQQLYVRDKFPKGYTDLQRNLCRGESAECYEVGVSEKAFVDEIIGGLNDGIALSAAGKATQALEVFRYWDRLSEAQSAVRAQFCQIFASCCRLVLEIKQNLTNERCVLTGLNHSSHLLFLAYTLESFVGVSISSTSVITGLKIFAHAVWVYCRAIGGRTQHPKFIEAVESTGELEKRLRFPRDPSSMDVDRKLDVQGIFSLIQDFSLQTVDVPSAPKATRGSFAGNQYALEACRTFSPGFGIKGDVEVILENLPNIATVVVQMMKPDSTLEVFRPSPNAFTPLAPHKYSVRLALTFDACPSVGEYPVRLVISKAAPIDHEVDSIILRHADYFAGTINFDSPTKYLLMPISEEWTFMSVRARQ
ncbi:Integrator complex subunit 4 [Borealophlyctis nickersoniae]|nr:Integrator complex subunit 4 [Borealophlyctis nickersoniae]